METVNKYRFKCETEDHFVTALSEEGAGLPPCPYGSNHVVDPDSYVIIDTIHPNDVLATIVDEEIQTGGRYQAKGIHVDVTTSGVSRHTVTFPIPISLRTAQFEAQDIHHKDAFKCVIGENTTIGVLASGVESGSYDIVADLAALEYLYVGGELYLTDGVNIDDLGTIISLDLETGEIHAEEPTMNAYSAETPTYIQTTTYVIRTSVITPGKYEFGFDTTRGKYIPANVPLTVIYTNNSGENKSLAVFIEYYY